MSLNNSSPAIFELAKTNRILISCTVELTENCIFKCPHCFIEGIGHHSLSYENFVSFINQFKRMGGVFLTLTGGEALTHSRFVDIYKYAYKLGLSVSVFTNGYLITQDIIQLFKECPPAKIEISLYGASKEKYQCVTGIENSFEKVLSSIDALLEAGVNLFLKTTLFNDIYPEFEAIRKIAEIRGVPFKYDFKLFPKRDGEKTNLCCQVPPDKVIAIEKKEKMELWKKEFPSLPKHRDYLFECGAARYSCFLSSKNTVRICAAATFSDIDMNTSTLEQAWKEFKTYTLKKYNESSKCKDCEKAGLCDICPIWGYVMHDDVNMLGREVSLHCELAEERLKELLNA